VVVTVVADVVVEVLVLEVEDSLPLSLPPQATVMVLTANAAAMAAVTESRREVRLSVMSALAPVSRGKYLSLLPNLRTFHAPWMAGGFAVTRLEVASTSLSRRSSAMRCARSWARVRWRRGMVRPGLCCGALVLASSVIVTGAVGLQRLGKSSKLAGSVT
jgi:hypothetical protein